MDRDEERLFRRKVLFVAALAIAALLFFYLKGLLLLVFGGILLAVVLDGLSQGLARRTPLSRGLALSVVVFTLLGLILLTGWQVGGRIADQASQFTSQLSQTVDRIAGDMSGSPLGRAIGQQLQQAKPDNMMSTGLFKRMTGVASAFFATVADALILLVVGLYLAAQPRRYTAQVLRLVPHHQRQRAEELVMRLGSNLRRYLLGKLVAMTVVGLLTGGGLTLIGVPFAIPLGLVAALFEFVPIFGPMLAAVPALLLALGQGSETLLMVAALYLAVQQVESYVLTPVIQKRAVDVPPVLTVVSVIAMGVLFGIPGSVLAEPLTVVIVVTARKLYLEDTLHEGRRAPSG